MQKGGNGSMPITDDAPAFERQGFLKEDFRRDIRYGVGGRRSVYEENYEGTM